MPFVALQFFDNVQVTIFLVCSFALWVMLNIVFFCTIDLSYLGTFFGTMTALQYTVMLYNTN